MYKHKKSKYLILIPAFNELNNLKKFVKKVNNLAPLYILDDCSRDKTENWLIRNKIKYIKNNENIILCLSIYLINFCSSIFRITNFIRPK